MKQTLGRWVQNARIIIALPLLAVALAFYGLWYLVTEVD